MRVAALLSVSAALLLSGLLSGCVVPTGPVEVTRFNRAAEGIVYGKGSYSLVLGADAGDVSTLSASPYLAAIGREMQNVGYVESNTASDVVAEIDVVTITRTAPKPSPVSVGVGGSTGSYGSGVGLGIGINLGSGPKPQVETTLSVKIRRRTDNLVIWEGKAVQIASAKSPAAQPGIAASKLAAALFQGFPGKSGETIQVK
jgi:Domain of unknown function (DUF4136)